MADTDVFGDTSAAAADAEAPVEKMSTEDLTEGAPPTTEDIVIDEEEAPKKVKEELLKEETEELQPASTVKEVVDENGDVYEETTEVARKVVKRTMKITETSSTTKTTTMTTPAKLYGKDLSEYDEVDVDALLAQLSPEEINILAKEVDPDDNFLPPAQRCSYECTKSPTGPLDRKKLIEHINKEALETPDLPEIEPFVKGTVRGKKWVPPPRDDREIAADEQIAIDMGEEYEHALSDATQEEIIDLAAILGFHSMMNQDQYHASLLNKGQPIGMGWDGITKSTQQKLYPMDPPNTTDIEESIKRVKEDDSKLIELNLNNIKNISDEKYEQLFAALPENEHLEVLSLTNVGLTDKTALLLAEAIEKSKTLRVLNVETNFISPPVIVTLVKSLLKARTIEEFRASNQRSTVLGNKIEMEITDLVEKNTSLLRLGLHLEFNDARHRVAAHLQRNIDRNEHELRKGNSLSPIPKSTSPISRGNDLLSMQKAKSPKPVHLDLTPSQQRIDSNSTSVVGQKQGDRARGEISLPVPQNRGPTKSPTRETEVPSIKKEEPPKTAEKAAITSPVPCEKSPSKDIRPLSPVQPKPEFKQISPAKEIKSENISPTKTEEPSAEISNTDKKSPSKESRFPIRDNISPPKPKIDIEALKIPPTPYHSIEEPSTKVEDVPKELEKPDERPLIEKKVSPTRHPKIGELRHSNMSRAFDEESDDTQISKPETVPKPQEKPIEPPEDRERFSQSVSPSRNLDHRMTLLQAKIDSFAEVADEKMASLRSKLDDISREPITMSSDEYFKSQKTRRPAQVVSPLESLTKLPEPTTKVSVTLPPTKTLNSVGITLLYQNQIFERPSPIPTVDLKKEPEKRSEATVGKAPTISLTPKEEQRKSLEKVTAPTIIEPQPNPMDKEITEVKTPIPVVVEPSIGIESKSSVGIESAIQPKSTERIKTPEQEPPKIKEIDANIENRPQKNNPEISQVPIESEKSKVDVRALVLSRLSVKKGDTLNIDPIIQTEAETQSLPKPSPLLRLSVKKGDPQKIDPVKMTEASTQSLPKPNPLSSLSIKRCETIAIDPAKTSDISTQFLYEVHQAEAASQTIEEEPTKTLEDSTQTPLVFSSLEHDYIFPGLRRVPYLPRQKTINIGGGDRVIVKPSSKPINEVLMLLYPVLHDHSKPKDGKQFGLEEDLIKSSNPDNTIKDLEDKLKIATEQSEIILNAPPKPPKEPSPPKEEEIAMERTEIEIPLVEESQPPSIASEARFETKYTAVEKVSAISRTTIESEERVEFIDKAYKSIAEVSTSEREKATTTSIKSANMWESLSSNLIKASEQTLMDLSKAAEMREFAPPSSSNRTKIGKISVYSSIEDLSTRSKVSDRHLGTLIKTVETTSVYSSMEDIPYTKYSDRYKDEKAVVSTASVYSSTEDLPQFSSSRYTLDPIKPKSMEELPDHYSAANYKVDLLKSVEKSKEKSSLLSRSKFSDRYKEDHSRSMIDTQLFSQQKLPLSRESSPSSSIVERAYYKSADHSASRSHYKSSEELLQRTKITDRGTHQSYKYQDSALQTSVQSSISRNQSALRPYTYVPSSANSLLSIDHVRPRPVSPSTHTTTLQLNVSPSGISELPATSRPSRYSQRDTIDKPMIKISRVRDDSRSFRAISPIEKRLRSSKNLLSPYQHQVSDPIDDDESIEESSHQPTLDTLSSASTTTTAKNDSPPKKRPNIMDTIKMLKNRVRDVITTEDRFTETHRLPTS